MDTSMPIEQKSKDELIGFDYGKKDDTGQYERYPVLPAEERQKGFVRPVRRSYTHVGIRPEFPTRPLTAEEKARYPHDDYVCYEEYPESKRPLVGRFWTQKDLNSGCQATTTMGLELAQTYARDPKYYSHTFCATCGEHLALNQFVWAGTKEVVGS